MTTECVSRYSHVLGVFNHRAGSKEHSGFSLRAKGRARRAQRHHPTKWLSAIFQPLTILSEAQFIILFHLKSQCPFSFQVCRRFGKSHITPHRRPGGDLHWKRLEFRSPERVKTPVVPLLARCPMPSRDNAAFCCLSLVLLPRLCLVLFVSPACTLEGTFELSNTTWDMCGSKMDPGQSCLLAGREAVEPSGACWFWTKNISWTQCYFWDKYTSGDSGGLHRVDKPVLLGCQSLSLSLFLLHLVFLWANFLPRLGAVVIYAGGGSWSSGAQRSEPLCSLALLPGWAC